MTTKEANDVIDRLTQVSVTLSELMQQSEQRQEETNRMMQTMIAIIHKSAGIAAVMHNDNERQRADYSKDLEKERSYFRGRIDDMINQRDAVQEQNDKLVDYQLRIDKHFENALHLGDNTAKNTTNVKIGNNE